MSVNLETLSHYQQRYQRFSTLDNIQIALLAELHQLKLGSDTLRQLTLQKAKKLEIYLVENRLAELAELLGISEVSDKMVPIEQSMLLSFRILRALPLLYRDQVELVTLNRSNIISMTASNLSWFADVEIESAFGIRPVLRADNFLIFDHPLASGSSHSYYEREFFYLTDPRLSINQVTILGEEVINPQTMLVAYGYLDSFVSFDINELVSAFPESGGFRQINGTEIIVKRKTKGISFTNPSYQITNYGQFNQYKIFSPSEVRSLQRVLRGLVRKVSSKNEFLPHDHDNIRVLDELLIMIEDGIKQLEENGKTIASIRNYILNCSNLEIALMKDWFTELFNLGWYFRRWRGPGHPYPLKTISTEDKSIDPTVKGSLAVKTLNQVNKLYCSMSRNMKRVVGRMDMMENTGRCYFGRNSKLITLINDINKCLACIRVASRMLIITAAGYLHHVFNINKAGWEPIELDIIS